MRTVILLLCFIGVINIAFSQEEELVDKPKARFGLVFTSVHGNNLIEQTNQFSQIKGTDFSVFQKPSWFAGFEVRFDYEMFAYLQTGFNYISKSIQIHYVDSNGAGSSIVKYSGNQIPLGALVMLRLGKNIHMGTAVGFSFDMFSVNSLPKVAVMKGVRFLNIGAYTSIGIERKDSKIGDFYAGIDYKIYFRDDVMQLNIYRDGLTAAPTTSFLISANYLGFSLKYYFPYKRVLPYSDPDFI